MTNWDNVDCKLQCNASIVSIVIISIFVLKIRVLIEDEEPDEASRQRIKMVLKENALEPYDINGICNPVNGPSPQEYHVLVKQGTLL